MPVDQPSRVEILRSIHLFRGFEEERLEEVALLLEEVELKADTVIYHMGDDADFFYLIYAGQVKLLREGPDRQMQEMGKLEDLDYFGHEVLESNWPRQISAVASSDVVLLRFSVENFIQALNILPSLGNRLQLVLDSYRLSLKAQFDFLEPNELVYYIARRHVLFMILKILPPLLLGVFLIPALAYFTISTGLASFLVFLMLALVVVLGWLAWAYVDWTNDYHIITSGRVIFLERIVLLYDSRQEAPLGGVQSSSINTTQIGRILGYGNVVIRTYYGTILFKEVANPEQVMLIMQDRQYHAQVIQRERDLQGVKKRVDEILVQGPSKVTPPFGRLQKPQPKPDPMQAFLATLLHQRYEISGSIVYRTHIFILLKKILVPLVLLFGLIFLQLYLSLSGNVYLPALSTCSITGLIGMIVFTWLAYQYMDWHNDVYIIGQEKIEDVNKKPLGREERRSAPIGNILNIEYKRLGLIGLILNFGTVFIQVGDQKLTFDDVYKPAEVQRELYHALSKHRQRERESQMRENRRMMEDWISSYHEIANRRQTPPETPPPARGGF